MPCLSDFIFCKEIAQYPVFLLQNW